MITYYFVHAVFHNQYTKPKSKKDKKKAKKTADCFFFFFQFRNRIRFLNKRELKVFACFESKNKPTKRKKGEKEKKKMLRKSVTSQQFATASASTGASASASAANPLHKLKLKSAQEYMKMSVAELQKLLDTRRAQLAELKDLHQTAHTSVEYVHRKQMLDWEEHAAHFAQAAGVMTGDTMMNCRERCKDIRNKNDTEDRDRWIVFFGLTFLTCVYWYWISKHYRERPDAPIGRRQAHNVMMGPFFGLMGDGKTWSSRHIETGWEAEKNAQKRERENARFPKERIDATVKKSDIEEGRTTPDGVLKNPDDTGKN